MRSLCQQCFCFTCPWHVSFKETPGWTAKETVIYEGGSEIKSFLVIECPFYKSRDGSRWIEVSLEHILSITGGKRDSFSRSSATTKLKDNLRECGFELKIKRTEANEKRIFFIKRIKKRELR